MPKRALGASRGNACPAPDEARLEELSMNDPHGYFARKAQREAAIRAAAPYRIASSQSVFTDFDALESHLQSYGLGIDLSNRSAGRYAIIDLATGSLCDWLAINAGNRFPNVTVTANARKIGAGQLAGGFAGYVTTLERSNWLAVNRNTWRSAATFATRADALAVAESAAQVARETGFVPCF